MYQFRGLSIERVSKVLASHNTNNHYRYRPYEELSPGRYVVDLLWWESCSAWFRQEAQKRFRIEFGVPHPRDSSPNGLYRLYHTSFDFQRWWNSRVKPRCSVLLLSSSDVVALRDAANGNITLVHTRLDRLYDRLNAVPWLKHPEGVFVRTSRGSGKRKDLLPLGPCHHAFHIMQRLTRQAWFYENEWAPEHAQRQKAVVVAPWNRGINRANEFRIFVRDRRVVALCPGYWFEDQAYKPSQLWCIYRALRQVNFLDDMCFQDWVGDVWIDWDTCEFHLIEANAYGAHSAAGSGLFSWIEDAALLDGAEFIRKGCVLRLLRE